MHTRTVRSLLVLIGTLACGGDGATEPGDPIVPNVPPAGMLASRGLGQAITQYNAEVWVRGDNAYTSTWGVRNGSRGNVIRTWNVAGDTPLLVNSDTIPGVGTTGDLQTSDDGRWLVVATEPSPEGSIVIFDLADAANPVFRTRYQSASIQAGVHTAEIARVGGRLYAFMSVPGGPSRLVVADITDPGNIVEVLSRPMGSPVIHDVFVRDGILFTALWDAGMTIWDIGGGGRGGTVANPVQLSSIRTVGGNAHNIAWFHDPADGSRRYAFVGEEGPATLFSSSSGSIHVVDVSNLTSPREVAFYQVPGAGTHNFSLDEARGVLYAAFYNGGVRALDIRGDLSSCTSTQQSADGRCDLDRMERDLAAGLARDGAVFVWGVHYLNDALYASDMLNGLWKLEAVIR